MPDATGSLDSAALSAPPLPSGGPYSGEVVYMYAFDVAYEMLRTPIRQLLGQSVAQFTVDASKRSPRQLFFYRAQMVRLPALERFGPCGPMRLERSVKIFPVGAISITVRIAFKVDRIADLIAFHDLRFTNGVGLYDEVRRLAEDVKRELEPFMLRPVEHLGEEEAYTVFCLTNPLVGADGRHLGVENWLTAHRRSVASLLTEENDPDHLSGQESDESTSKYFSYYDRDLVVLDWDAALVVDEHRYIDETLYILELANLQLAELEAYDRLLDEVVDRAYRDLGAQGWRRKQNPAIQRELREIRVDLARLSDVLSNITKFFGDWHLAHIYQGISARFHLADWHHAIDEKLKTLDDLYQLLQADRNERWMFMLEFTMLVLIVIELLVALVGLRH